MAFHCRKLEHTSHGAQDLCVLHVRSHLWLFLSFLSIFPLGLHETCMSAWKEMKTGPGKWTCKPECLKVCTSLHATSCDSHIAPMQGKAGDQETHGRTERTQTRNWASMKVSVFTICTALQYCTQTQIWAARKVSLCIANSAHCVLSACVLAQCCVCVSTAWEFPANAHGPEATHCWEEEYEQVYLILPTLRWLNLKGGFFLINMPTCQVTGIAKYQEYHYFSCTHCWVGMRWTSKLLANFEVTWVDLNASLGGEEVPFRSYIRHITTFLMQGLQQFDRFSDFTESVAAILAMILLNATVVWKVFIGFAFLSWVVLSPFPLAPPIKSKKKSFRRWLHSFSPSGKSFYALLKEFGNFLSRVWLTCDCLENGMSGSAVEI